MIKLGRFLYISSKERMKCLFQEFKELAETQTGKRLKAVRTDEGKEYVNQAMKEFVRTNGIRHQTTMAYTPEQNGVSFATESWKEHEL